MKLQFQLLALFIVATFAAFGSELVLAKGLAMETSTRTEIVFKFQNFFCQCREKHFAVQGGLLLSTWSKLLCA